MKISHVFIIINKILGLRISALDLKKLKRIANSFPSSSLSFLAWGYDEAFSLILHFWYTTLRIYSFLCKDSILTHLTNKIRNCRCVTVSPRPIRLNYERLKKFFVYKTALLTQINVEDTGQTSNILQAKNARKIFKMRTFFQENAWYAQLFKLVLNFYHMQSRRPFSFSSPKQWI